MYVYLLVRHNGHLSFNSEHDFTWPHLLYILIRLRTVEIIVCETIRQTSQSQAPRHTYTHTTQRSVKSRIVFAVKVSLKVTV